MRKYASAQVNIYASAQERASALVSKYLHKDASVQVRKYSRVRRYMHKCESMQIRKYASMQVCKCARKLEWTSDCACTCASAQLRKWEVYKSAQRRKCASAQLRKYLVI